MTLDSVEPPPVPLVLCFLRRRVARRAKTMRVCLKEGFVMRSDCQWRCEDTPVRGCGNLRKRSGAPLASVNSDRSRVLSCKWWDRAWSKSNRHAVEPLARCVMSHTNLLEERRRGTPFDIVNFNGGCLCCWSGRARGDERDVS